MSKILVIDDSATMRQQVRMALKPTGFDIVEAVDGQDGLEKLCADIDIDIVLLDVNMPRMDGIQMIEALQRSGRVDTGLRVVMLTTEGRPDLVKKAKAAGAKGWIVKPFKPALLLAAIQKIAD